MSMCVEPAEGTAAEVRPQHHSVAPTLPIHSPHSPLLTDRATYQPFKETKLSARYINNINFLCNSKKSSEQDLSRSDTMTTQGNKAFSTKLLCYCEKNEAKFPDHPSHSNVLNARMTKRLVPTRNAATSPHLDIRKIGSMTTLAPSPSLTNELSVKANATDCQKTKLKTLNDSAEPCSDEQIPQVTLQRKKSLVEFNSLKILRTTRSLSPRPPLRHQNATLAPDSFKVNIDFTRLRKAYTRASKMQIKKLSRSEQSSPNVAEGSEIHFSYNESTNRSTSCLGSSFADPWFRNSYSDCKASNPTLTVKEDYEPRLTNRVPKNKKDPWVKRADVERDSALMKYELIRQRKSLAGAKFDNDMTSIESKIKSPVNLTVETKKKFNADSENQLKSAPTSPHLLTAENNFISYAYLSKKQLSADFSEKTPTRSASFSPARIKNSQNPFRDSNLHLTNSPPNLLSVGSEISKDQMRNKTNQQRPANYDFLNVCRPNFLTARHSFSSVTEERKGEELQLNIRRLSDQMNHKEPVPERVVRERRKHEKKVLKSSNETTNNPKGSAEGQLKSADFSDYLEQFRCSEAKKAAPKKEKTYFQKDKLIAKTTSNPATAIGKTLKPSDCLLETTC